MHTAVISDLHLGTRSRIDLLRRPEVRARLVEALRGFDELVLLGDAIELRDRPLGEALAVAEPFLEEAGAAIGNGRAVLVPGNHDHALARAAAGDRRPRNGFTRDVTGARGVLPAIRDRLGIPLVVAYPSHSPRPDVWMTHGHYLDGHSSAPTFECAASEALGLLRRRPSALAREVDDYEAVLAPTYALFYAIAQRRRVQRLADEGKRIVREVERRLGTRGPDDPDREPAPGGPPPPSLGGARFGPAPGELRRPGILPLRRVLDRLGIEAEHVVFGHTHRTGPVLGDDMGLWVDGSTSLTNTGSWVYEPAYVGSLGPAGPYWPGTLVGIGDAGPPVVHRLLPDIGAGSAHL